ncbi:HAMP domain-containing sensor histidine kinase [Flavobacterium ovatum]|uniref:sensor histidine kinase n=1 Tax=Flavobacterium ovatum TaxID=1928857 RepID=UPI00345073D6
MVILKFIKNNRTINTVLAVIFILTIGVIDYNTGTEMAFSLFYIGPIVLLSLHNKVQIQEIFLCATIAAISWSYSEYSNVILSHVFFPIWNSFVRFAIYLTIGLLFFRFKEKERKIRLVNKKLNELNLEKNKFIGIAAHDLANPIASIYAFSDLLIENKLENTEEDINEGLQIIKDLSSNTLGVLKNLLNVSVIESGKIDLKIETHNYIDFIKKQIIYNQIIAKNKSINIHLETDSQLAILLFDDHYLSEVTSNLLSNAIKFSYSGGKIIVKVSQKEGFIVTEIIDQGKGIPQNEQEKLFYYFQKSSTQPTQGESSTGLGLAIAKQIVDLHKGSIGLKSTLNEGSNFYFKLPIKTV